MFSVCVIDEAELLESTGDVRCEQRAGLSVSLTVELLLSSREATGILLAGVDHEFVSVRRQLGEFVEACSLALVVVEFEQFHVGQTLLEDIVRLANILVDVRQFGLQLLELLDGRPVRHGDAQILQSLLDLLAALLVLVDEHLEFVVTDDRLPFDELLVGQLRAAQFVDEPRVVQPNSVDRLALVVDELMPGMIDLIVHGQILLFQRVDAVRQRRERLASMLIRALEANELATVRALDERRRTMANLTLTSGFDLKVARLDKIEHGLIDGQIGELLDRRADLFATVGHGTRVGRRFGAVPFIFEACRA